MIQNVVVLRDLVAIGHVDKEFDGDLRVVNDEIRQFSRAHVNVEDHFFVRFE